jgi:hypothetical protein
MIVDARKSRFMSCPPSFIFASSTKAPGAPPAGKAVRRDMQIAVGRKSSCARGWRLRSIGRAQSHSAAMHDGMRIGVHPLMTAPTFAPLEPARLTAGFHDP